jgi:hypothetical protein
MLRNQLLTLGAIGGLTGLGAAQFPPKPEGVSVLESKLEDGVRISYKEVRICHNMTILRCGY